MNKHILYVIIPGDTYEVQVPTFQGIDAAARRVLFSFMARFGVEPEHITIGVLNDDCASITPLILDGVPQ